MYSRFSEEDNNLAYDARFRMRPTPSEWGYNWDYAECSTPNPTPRRGHGTLWIVANLSGDPVQDIRNLFRDANLGPVKFVAETSNNDEGERECRVVNRRTNEMLLGGHVENDPEQVDPNVGHYAILRSKTMEGLALMANIQAGSTHGHSAWIEHNQVEMPIGSGYKVVVKTGEAPDGDEEERRGLGTRFTLYDGEEEVGRCHMSYTDGTWDPCLGPTIEMIAIKQTHRGRGLIKVLWHWVRSFIEENFTIECLNNDAPVGHVMIKATQLTNGEIDVTGSGQSLTDRDFFYNYCGFSVRVQKGAGAMLMGANRPADEEAVLYVPLLSRQEIRRRGRQNGGGPEIGDATFIENMGARSCFHCNRIRTGLSKCARCRDAYYCDRNCQRKDWKRHKLWCCKSSDVVHEELVRRGKRVKSGDGWAEVAG